MKLTRNSIISTVLFALLVATLMTLEEFYEGDMNTTTVIEEIIAYLSILGLLFIFIVAPFQKLIDLLDKKLPWKGHFFKRMGIESLAVIGLSISLGFIFGEFIHLYIDHVLEAAAVVLRTMLFLLICSSIIMALLELRQLHDEKDKLLQLSQQLEKEKIETLYNSLKQQVNPHFLFNSLSVLSSLIHYDVKKADDFIQHFSDIYRYVLDINKQRLVTLNEELQFLESYLFLQQIRFGENIHIDSKIDQNNEGNKYLPPLSLQLVFENILKHNIVSKEYPMKVTMSFDKENLLIQNAMKPRQDVVSSGIGIKNLTDKYQILQKQLPSFQKGKDTYTVSLPLLKSSIS